ncbi:hypothetical protein MKEN_00399100 [Mycena kentingensis (nom. inval.)]|nr:hypothetical protein MKEN_00399100 [Mycena kentingensis (nom. inval.)]
MPPATVAREKPPTRLDEIAEKLTTVVQTLDILSDGVKTPFLESISLTMHNLLGGVQNIRTNKNESTNLLETVNKVLHAVVALHLQSDADLAHPGQLAHMARVVECLHTVFTLLETQRETSRIKRFFNQGENAAMFKTCEANLQSVLQGLKVQNIGIFATMKEIENDLALAHQKILEMIQTTSDTASFSTDTLSGASASSASVSSFIPPNPKIFHGREVELAHIVDIFTRNTSPSLAILGPGGIGKTSLAQAAMHHTQMADKYSLQCCVYAACDTAQNAQGILILIGSQLGTKTGQNLRADITDYLSGKAPHLIGGLPIRLAKHCRNNRD